MIRYGTGVDYLHSLHEAIKVSGVAEVSGPWVKVEEEKWQGVSGLSKLIAKDENLEGKLTSLVRENYGWQ